jgi:hypothetical protein
MTERLRTSGFLFTRTDVALPVLSVDFGEGYMGSAVIGAPSGTRGWSAKVDVLPDGVEAPPIEGMTRAAHLWNLFLASKLADDEPFWLYDHKDDLFYLVSFTDDTLSYDLLCAKIYSTGLQFRQRRINGVTSPIDGIPLEDELGGFILDESAEPILDEGVF